MLQVNHLNGFGAGGAAGPATLAFHDSAVSTAAAVTGPAGIIAGDLLVLYQAATHGSLPALVRPTGFLQINTQTDGANIRIDLSYKLADGSEASASLTGMDGNLGDTKILFVFRPDVPATLYTPLDADGIVPTVNNPAAQTVTASAGPVPLVVIGAYWATGAIDPRTFTVGGSAAKDGEVNNSTGRYLAYKIFNTSPSDCVIDMDDEGSNCLQTCYIVAS